jgi:uncharacterized protein Veg
MSDHRAPIGPDTNIVGGRLSLLHLSRSALNKIIERYFLFLMRETLPVTEGNIVDMELFRHKLEGETTSSLMHPYASPDPKRENSPCDDIGKEIQQLLNSVVRNKNDEQAAQTKIATLSIDKFHEVRKLLANDPQRRWAVTSIYGRLKLIHRCSALKEYYAAVNVLSKAMSTSDAVRVTAAHADMIAKWNKLTLALDPNVDDVKGMIQQFPEPVNGWELYTNEDGLLAFRKSDHKSPSP